MEEEERGFPILVVVALMMVVIALFGWCFMAAQYAHAVEGKRAGAVIVSANMRVSRGAGLAMMVTSVLELFSTGVQQLPNLPAVIGFNLRHRLWLPITIVVVELLAAGAGVGLKHIEQKLEDPPLNKSNSGKKKKKKKRKSDEFQSPW